VYKSSGCDSKTIPFDLDFDCSLLAATSSGGFRGSILGPSRLEADEGNLLVSEIFFVVDDFGSFVDSDGLDAFVVFVMLVICTGLAVIGKLVVHCVDDEGTLAVLFNIACMAMKASIFSFDSLQLSWLHQQVKAPSRPSSLQF